MSSSELTLVAALAGLLIAAGLWVSIAALRGWAPQRAPRPRAGAGRRAGKAVEELPEVWRRNYRHLLIGSVVIGVGVWVWTGWPVHGLLAAGALSGLPFLLHPGGSARLQIARLEAMAQWLQQLASVHGGGKPLEQTVIDSLPNSPRALRREITDLAGRLEAQLPAVDAYRLFADDLGDRTGDEVTMLFMDHAGTRGPGLAKALTRMAELVGRNASDFRDIDTDRAKVRSNARRVSLFVLAVVSVALANPAYTAPYGTLPGQAFLTGLGVLFVLALRWMRRMAQPRPEPRLLHPLTNRELEKEEVPAW
ncbi:hypothetical protein OG453_44630 [Streptomyces sp. NBC_01381]|uniref:type II secretion system F family protein n=1 Tax=Streptomyces sp. NBC_01381 TaxID=2903845 RepID=UPI00225310CE|nr:hypothetical protein [Streptomyces sp. NBC_01381]MCX4673646.1 hypothetical protein [Streptomyces sp. NBC_01381]